MVIISASQGAQFYKGQILKQVQNDRKIKLLRQARSLLPALIYIKLNNKFIE